MWHIWLALLLSAVCLTSAQGIDITLPQKILNSKTDGGMYGRSVAFSLLNETGWTYMAVGEPWMPRVHLYRIKNPDQDFLIDLINGTIPKANNSIPAMQLEELKGSPLSDPVTQSYPDSTYSLFGYSVALTPEGAWLAVGVPARTNGNMESGSYHGSVVLYRRDTSTDEFKYICQIVNPFGTGPAGNPGHHDKFGSYVHWGRYANYTNTYLAVGSTGGWDGTSTQYHSGRPGTNTWNIVGPTTYTDRSGARIFKLNPSKYHVTTQTDYDKVLEDPKGQFINQLSRVPMGIIGPVIEFHESNIVNATNPNVTTVTPGLTLMMRDFVLDPTLNPTIVNDFCPKLDCNYIRDGENEYGSIGIVREFQLNITQGKFVEVGRMSAQSFQFDDSIDPTKLNFGYDRQDYRHTDWFGAGIGISFDQKYGRFVSLVGAPRDGTVAFPFYRSVLDHNWKSGRAIRNDAHWRRSFFGGTIKFSPDASFALIADAAGTADSMGRGRVYLYHRRSKTEEVFPSGLRPNVIEDDGAPVPLRFDYLARLRKSADTTNPSSYYPDQFGVSMAINKYFIAIGSPISREVYLYYAPTTVEIELPVVQDPVVPTAISNYTIIAEPVPTAVEYTPQVTIFRPRDTSTIQTADEAWMYALIGGISALLLLVPTAIFSIIRWHRIKILKELAAQGDPDADAGAFNTDSTAEIEDNPEPASKAQSPVHMFYPGD